MTATATASTLETLALSDGYAALGPDFVERRFPEPLPAPYLIATSPDVAELLGLDPGELERPEFLALAAGNARFRSVEPFAAVYAGHQFGTFVPQLGDGRAIALGEIEAPAGRSLEWQLKGAGQTAFSRFADGRAVLRSTIREFLCSEAMAALGIPTTRALAIAGSDAPVFREKPETAAVLTRISPSHLRFGTFEYFHYRGRPAAVKTLADYAIRRFYPHLATLEPDAERYAAFLREVSERTARLIAQWQAVGFAHGVMNTDNMSILGLTLDYGPFGFLDAYEAGFICNHTDVAGRYAFDRQPTIGLWNVRALAAALSSLIEEAGAEAVLGSYEHVFRETYLEHLSRKFGLLESQPGDAELYGACFTALQNGRVDYTLFFRELSSLSSDEGAANERVAALFENRSEWAAWLRRYRDRLASEDRDDAARHAAMRTVNPKYVLRNYLAQAAIEAAEQRDYTELERLHATLRTPFEDQPGRETYALPPPESARSISVSCSS